MTAETGSEAPLTLRGHHLLCSAQYRGNGYSTAFVENFDRICERMSAGEAVRLTLRPDSICQPVRYMRQSHCGYWRIVLRDLVAFAWASIVTRRMLYPGRTVRLTGRDIGRIRSAFKLGRVRPSCVGCEWYRQCGTSAYGRKLNPS